MNQDRLKRAKCVDFHAHAVTEGFRRAIEELGINPMAEDGFPLPEWGVEEHLCFMADAGIDLSVLSAPVPHLYNGDAKKSGRGCKAAPGKCDHGNSCGNL